MDEKDFLAELIPNLRFLEELSQQTSSQRLDKSWLDFFERIGQEKTPVSFPSSPSVVSLEDQMKLLIEAYRRYGHLMAAINPLSSDNGQEPPPAKLRTFRISRLSKERALSQFRSFASTTSLVGRNRPCFTKDLLPICWF